ncbi:MAG: 6-carboxytetrahydropterin synthase [Pseudomonadota bacterium]
MRYRSSKTFRGFPCAHRKWRHEGHCAWVHGYSREFIVWFEAEERDENGFVMDFGALDEVRDWLNDKFDHTLLIDADDPLLPEFRALEAKGAAKLTVFEDVGMEGTAKYVYDYLNPWVQKFTDGRVHVASIECRENEKNSGILLVD